MTNFETDYSQKKEINYEAFDHIKFWVGNAKQAASFYCSYLGFTPYSYKGLETGSRNTSCHVVRNNKAVFCFESALPSNENDEPSSPTYNTDYIGSISEFLSNRGDGVVDIAFTVDDAEKCYNIACERGATGVKEPWKVECSDGYVKMSTISINSGTLHTFVERRNFKPSPSSDVAFLPGFKRCPQADAFCKKGNEASCTVETPICCKKNVNINFIDHVVSNQPDNMMTPVSDRYEKILGLHKFWSVDDKDIHTEYSSLRSTVMADKTERIKLPINEPAVGKRKSQIEEFVEYNGNQPGVQHIALNTDNIIETIDYLTSTGTVFLKTPKSYYDLIRKKLAAESGNLNFEVSESIDDLERLNILIDYDENGYLLQIFTMPLQDRPTFFVEFIQRRNHNGFGAGNFKSLFESIEREQEIRGNL
ncbi:4-hydroxyphenylpyruvate dioxygenase [Smittium culicis]|uniref:4-hydroxyphenylpyruvate dioxygenase n=1 Tax=Smittium culicis TaxID=133412 RepID=A0A1R1XV36_9FUNG|nr:4-hydroxyphenylpyruvate dioxygenase [Smittium culicis]OMJ20163.1 4-hydroxyphenylpyruvate dioxygenase [Smittium culicis]